MFKFTVIYLTLLILVGIMGGLNVDSYNHPHAELGQWAAIVIIWLFGSAIASGRARARARAERSK